MTAYVIDASVILKWFVPEEHSEPALRLQHTDARLHVPAFLTLEIGNVLAKKRRRGELTAPDAEDIWRAFRRAPVRRHADEPLVFAAFDLAHLTKQSVYDSLYLALAMKLDLPFLTADRKFYQALQHGEYRSRLRWIEDLP
ncbi:MAG TPA: type II toxin-antitoxin system VapC family toxin [Nitrospiraceae bacterium]|nr:type II toxin-antitoxin system VapC family toxin [Nitrospiraceae bacterium]